MSWEKKSEYPFRVMDQKKWWEEHKNKLEEAIKDKNVRFIGIYMGLKHPGCGYGFHFGEETQALVWASHREDPKDLLILASVDYLYAPELYRGHYVKESPQRVKLDSIHGGCLGNLAALYARYPEDVHLIEIIRRWQAYYRKKLQEEQKKKVENNQGLADVALCAGAGLGLGVLAGIGMRKYQEGSAKKVAPSSSEKKG